MVGVDRTVRQEKGNSISREQTVLIVDDEAVNIELMAAILQPRYRVQVALSGERAIALLEQDALPDLILMDVEMEGMDGYQTCLQIKGTARLADIPIIFITTRSKIDDELKGFECGAADYISKPFSAAIVLSRVASHIELAQRRSTLELQVEKRTHELRRALKEMDLALSMRDEFLATLSHELRTPLAAITGFTELLLDEVSNPDHQQCLHSIMEASSGQLTLIEKMLDVSAIKSGKLLFTAVPFQVNQLVNELIVHFDAEARSAGLSLSVTMDHLPVEEWIGDKRRVSQILEQLLDNAIKFTDAGQITVQCSCVEEQIQFKVIDSGIGISEENLGRIFNCLEQGDSSLARKHGGTGLGLYISNSLAEQMGGKLTVESELGEGSIFTLLLPQGVVR